MTDFPDSDWQLALIDLDGTLYRGNEPIPGAPAFVQRLRRRGIQPVYFTNNSSRTPVSVASKLQGMGFVADAQEVVTSAQMAASMLRKRLQKHASVAYIGGEGLHQALTLAGFHAVHSAGAKEASKEASRDVSLLACQAAVLGIDQTVTYDDLARFCQVVQRLGWFVLTNADVRLPHEGSFLPGNGALGSFVATATGVQPIIAGKPAADYVAFALARFGVQKDHAVIIGDNLLTDILAGVAAGVDSILVASGVAYEAADALEIQPTQKASSVAELF